MRKETIICDVCGKEFGEKEKIHRRSIKVNISEVSSKLGDVGERRALTFDDICLDCASGIFALIENFCLKRKTTDGNKNNTT